MSANRFSSPTERPSNSRSDRRRTATSRRAQRGWERKENRPHRAGPCRTGGWPLWTRAAAAGFGGRTPSGRAPGASSTSGAFWLCCGEWNWHASRVKIWWGWIAYFGLESATGDGQGGNERRAVGQSGSSELAIASRAREERLVRWTEVWRKLRPPSNRRRRLRSPVSHLPRADDDFMEYPGASFRSGAGDLTSPGLDPEPEPEPEPPAMVSPPSVVAMLTCLP
jgi:hypothetical protein